MILFSLYNYIAIWFFKLSRWRCFLFWQGTSYSLSLNILRLYNFLVEVRVVTSKKKVASGIRNLVKELPHDFKKSLEHGFLGNRVILEKPQIWVSTFSSAHSSFQKLIFGHISQNLCKIWYQTSNSTGFLYFVLNIFSGIVGCYTY